MTPSRSYEFGAFRLDAAARVLFRDGHRVALTPKAVDVLIILVEARGQPVGKEELLQKAWAGTIVEEGSITSHVSLLRKALSEGGGDGFIETLSKRGYRFVGPVGDASQPARPAALRTLTFLCAAIEGSADASAAAKESQNKLLRDAFTMHSGRALRIADDALCVAFTDAASAVLAAVDTQRAISAQSHGDAAIRARIGLHSGAVEDAKDQDFSGPALARAARVMAAAHGDQILLTAATVALLDRATPPGGELRDLGDHTLRGFARPERIYQLTVAGLRSDFPPIRTQEAMRTNLPPSLRAFIGRQKALAEVREQVRQSRMVTLVGAGGTGKTRLSLETARQLATAFPDGIWLVELAPLADAALISRAVAAALGARAEGDAPPMTLIESTLRNQQVLLLLLDNCEHVIDEAAHVAQALLRALPQLHLLATSREPLGIEDETVYRVPSLTMPGSHESAAPPDVIASEAGQLFVERAIAVQPAFALTDRNAAAVAQVCRRLDGIPLAIELAAVRLTALSVEEIARRIDDRFHLLTGGLRTALPRHRTLRALVDWSYDLLSAVERAVLGTLSVFAGSFSLEAAERVCADDAVNDTCVLDAVEHLVAKSLVIAEMHDGTATRYHLLETIRQYANVKLRESGRAEPTRRRHFDYFLGLVETGAAALNGPSALEWLDRLAAEQDNVRAALDGAARSEDYARLAGAMRYFWDTRAQFTEGWIRLGHAVGGHGAHDLVRLEALIGAGVAAHRLAYARSDDLLGEVILLAQELGSAAREAEATLWLANGRSFTHGDADAEPLRLRALALAKAAGDRRQETLALMELGRGAWGRGELAIAQALYLQGARLGREAGCVIDTPSAIYGAGACALDQLDFEAARRLLDEALVQHRRIGNTHEAAVTLWQLGRLALNVNRLDEARSLSSESLRIFRTLLDPKCGGRAARFHATVLSGMGDEEAALQHAESAVESFRELGMPLAMAISLCTVGCIHAKLGQGDAARSALFSGLIEQQRADRDTHLPELLEAVAALHPDVPAAAQLLGSAAAVRERLDIPLLPVDREESERRHADVRARLPDSEFDRAFAAGRALTRNEAIQSALALQQPS